MRKIMSLKQLTANRRNALKSTGPKTVNGKAVSRLNALKHGVLAQTVVARGRRVHESPARFRQLCQDLYASLQPEGPLEEMLVDEIAAVNWRLRRLRRAETGEVTLSVDSGAWRREKDNPLKWLLLMPPGMAAPGLLERLRQSVKGCRYLAFCLRRAREAVEAAGELTPAILKDLEEALRGQAEEFTHSLRWHLDRRNINPENLAPEAWQARHREEVIQYLDRELEDLGIEETQNAKRGALQERAEQSAALLPADAKLDKLLRYEAALERQWYRAMNQLERLQRRRRGEAVPAPLTLEVSPRI